ncbi:hypothetical protein NEN25_27335, partial [Escherichia coli]|nr:hypothetical protein [Escherichia coli]MEB7231901.1 hypothetical protein [Escherichia coli]MEB7360619.1 hypothetical protein [Escherichia coli]
SLYTAWCRVPPGEQMSVISVGHTGNDTISPLRTGGFTMPVFFNKLLINQTIINLMNCEEFNISQHSLFPA